MKTLPGHSKKTKISTCLIDNEIFTEKQLADKINEAFSSLTEHMSPLQPSQPVNQFEPIAKFIISEDEVYKKLSHLQPSKSPGPDDLPTWMFKLYAPFLAGSIVSIFNKSIQQSIACPSQVRKS